ncbi:MAG: sugar nucleotide-binding protein [Elusimicrobia bacterium]|nr:sugar nucleotide-binding protein [Elusimicrobiota bacterium]
MTRPIPITHRKGLSRKAGRHHSAKPARKILILGGSGFVGRRLFARLGPEGAVATYNRNPISGGIRFDAVSMRLPDVVPDPDSVGAGVILLGDTSADRCARDLERSHELNVVSVQAVIDVLRGWGKKILFTSSEYVFDGERGGYDELCPPGPILAYGRQKLEVERYLAERDPGALILRLARVVSARPGDKTLLSSWLPAIAKGGVIRCAGDQAFSPLFADDAVTGILRALDLDLRGIFHLAGPRPYRRIELLEMLLAQMRKHGPVSVEIEPCGVNDFPLKERHPIDVSLDPAKFIKATRCRFRGMPWVCRELVKAARAQAWSPS